MKTRLAALLIAAASAVCATGTETAIALDVSRRNTSISLTFTECCDHAVRAAIRDRGDDFNCSGWEVNLVFGAGDRGVVHEGIVQNVNEVLFDIPASSMPTNGKYTVQVLAMKAGRSNEWGRGTLRVNANPGMEYMPTCWMGYQKVARLAASMITTDRLTNEVVQAMREEFAPRRLTVTPWTNNVLVVKKSFGGTFAWLSMFVQDRTQPTKWWSTRHNGVFTWDGSDLTNAVCTVTDDGGVEVFSPTNIKSKVWFRSDRDPARYFLVHPLRAPESVYVRELGQ